MKTRFLIMKPGEPHETGEVEFPEVEVDGERIVPLKALQALIEPITGEPMEHVTVFTDFKGGDDYRYGDMFVNEEGKWKGFARNDAATVIYRRNTLFHEPGKYMAEDLDEIVGPAVLFEEIVWK